MGGIYQGQRADKGKRGGGGKKNPPPPPPISQMDEMNPTNKVRELPILMPAIYFLILFGEWSDLRDTDRGSLPSDRFGRI